MASASVTEELPMSPQQAWDAASDLSRFDEWMTIHAGWVTDLPDQITKGTKVSSIVKVKAFRNRINWTVTRCDEPTAISLAGTGRGGVKINLDMMVSGSGDTSTVRLDGSFTGPVLAGPIGTVVARAITGDMHQSVKNLAKVT